MFFCLHRGTTGGGLPLDHFVSIAAAAGFEGADVDFAYAESHGAAALADLYATHKQRIGGWGPPIDWRGDPAKLPDGLARLKKQAAVAAELKADSCSTWLMPSSDLPLLDNWNFHVTRLKPVAQALADHGLRFGLEYVAPFHLRRKGRHEFLFTPGQLLELAAAIGPNVGLLVDSIHHHTAGDTWAHLAKVPADKIVWVHINDVPKVPVPDVEDGKRLLPGDGGLDLAAFLGALKTAGYAGPVSLEVFNADLRKMPPADAAKKSWAAMKPLVEGFRKV